MENWNIFKAPNSIAGFYQKYSLITIGLLVLTGICYHFNLRYITDLVFVLFLISIFAFEYFAQKDYRKYRAKNGLFKDKLKITYDNGSYDIYGYEDLLSSESEIGFIDKLNNNFKKGIKVQKIEELNKN